MRGFQTQQIGQTLDGIPLGDMTYGNFNGLNIARAIDPANLSSTTVEQGSGALGTASANNLGGVIAYRSADPSSQPGVRLQQMAGDFRSFRTDLRLDMGAHALAPDRALSGYVSYARTDNDKWKGGGQRFSDFPGDHKLFFGQSGLLREGENWQDQFNARADLLLGGSRLTAFYDFSDKKESDYMDLSLGVFNDPRFGPRTDYWTSWATAKQYAEYTLPPYNPLGDVAYFMSAQGARQDHLAYLRGDFRLGSRARVVVSPYVHRNRGGGDWHAPSYGASYSPDPIMFRQTQYAIDRRGVLATAVTELGSFNRLEGGVWLESNDVRMRRPRWRLRNYQAGPEVDFSNVLQLDFDRTGDLGTTMLYLQNTSTLLDERLRLTYGFKWLHVNADFHSNGNTPTDGVVAPLSPDATRPDLSLPTKAGILPQLGAVFGLNHTDELFANYSENVNQYPYSPQTGAYNASTSLFPFLESTHPERSSTIDLGVRTSRSGTEGSLAVYYIDYRNRLLGIALCPPTVTCATGLGNVGSVRSLGAEALLSQHSCWT